MTENDPYSRAQHAATTSNPRVLKQLAEEDAFGNSAADTALDAHEPGVQEEPPNKQSVGRTVVNFIATLLVALAFMVLLRVFVFESYEIPSGSMEDTIMTGDLVFAEKVTTYFAAPERGSIMTFEDPEYADNPDQSTHRTLIKRLIATGGQTIDLRDGDVYVDGVKLYEPYTDGKPTYPLNGKGSAGIEYPYLIPAGHLWFMGDNRTASQDSRYFGAVPVSYIQGHALFIYWPLDELRVL